MVFKSKKTIETKKEEFSKSHILMNSLSHQEKVKNQKNQS